MSRSEALAIARHLCVGEGFEAIVRVAGACDSFLREHTDLDHAKHCLLIAGRAQPDEVDPAALLRDAGKIHAFKASHARAPEAMETAIAHEVHGADVDDIIETAQVFLAFLADGLSSSRSDASAPSGSPPGSARSGAAAPPG